MNGLQNLALLMRRVAGLCVLGFAVLFLSGPVIGIVATVLSLAIGLIAVILPFVLIGLLVWVPIQALTRRRFDAWKDVLATGQSVSRRAVKIPVQSAVNAYHGSVELAKRARDEVRGTTRLVGGIVFEALSGGMVGSLIGAVVAYHYQSPIPIGIGAAIGSLLGILVGASRFRNLRESRFIDSPEQLS